MRAGQAVSAIGGTVLLEPVSGADAYPLKTAADVLSVIDRVKAAGATTSRCWRTSTTCRSTATTSTP